MTTKTSVPKIPSIRAQEVWLKREHGRSISDWVVRLEDAIMLADAKSHHFRPGGVRIAPPDWTRDKSGRGRGHVDSMLLKSFSAIITMQSSTGQDFVGGVRKRLESESETNNALREEIRRLEVRNAFVEQQLGEFAQKAGTVAFAFFGFAAFVYLLTGTVLVNPLITAGGSVASVGFFFFGRAIRKSIVPLDERV